MRTAAGHAFHETWVFVGKCFMLSFSWEDHHLLNAGSCDKESDILELLEQDMIHFVNPVTLWKQEVIFLARNSDSKRAAGM